VFLTFVVVVGTLLLHGLTLPWLIKVLDVQNDDAQRDVMEEAAAQTRAAKAASDRLEELLAEDRAQTDVHQRAATILRGWNSRRIRHRPHASGVTGRLNTGDSFRRVRNASASLPGPY